MTNLKMNNYNNKISDLIDNSNTKLNAAHTLAESGDFGTASAILVTAFEERVKALVLQLVEVGFPLVNDISELDYVFSQHDSRHYIGFFVDCFYETLEDFFPFIKRFIEDEDFRKSFLSFEPTEEMEVTFITWVSSKKDSFLKKLDFYQNIEKQRQCGLYIDVLRTGGTNKPISEDDYHYIKTRLGVIHLMSNDMQEIIIDQDPKILEMIAESREEMLNQDVPSLVVFGLEYIRKIRGKGFKKMRQALNEFSVEANLKDSPTGLTDTH